MPDNALLDKKRVAKNTLLLYMRMLLMMVVSLYTSRVVLKALGVEDYGIFNVVGGLVSMFSILSSSLSSAISRFITYELGNNDIEKLKKVFCTSVNVQIALIVLIVLLLEPLGLWFLNNKLVIPEGRLVAARWVFQFSVLTFVVNLWSIPYNALIIAHERMSAFAYISLFEAFAKLLVAFLIMRSPIDRLVCYSGLIFLVGLIQRSIYARFCRKNFAECDYKPVFNREITREMFSFAGWNFIGSSSAILRDQGGNILINLFFGPAVNAARAAAMSVNSAVSGFVSNFMTALNPQITKSYASGERDYMFELIFQGAKFSFFILSFFAIPIIMTAPYILDLWLEVVPEHTVEFVPLVLVFTLSESLAHPLVTAMLATGNIRNYQLIVGGCQLLNLPLSYLFLKLGYPPECVFVVAILLSVLCEMVRLLMLKNMIGLPVASFLKNVYFKSILVFLLSCALPLLLRCLIGMEDVVSFLVIVLVSLVSTAFFVYFVGCTSSDRKMVINFFGKTIKRIRHNA
ncbi:MAG: lipopolysaccharide biosynthesis protein [Candidatus Cryptobacteroides sp.]